MFKRLKEKIAPLPKMYPERPDTLHLLPEELLTPLAKMHIQKTLVSGGAVVTLRKGKQYLSLAVMQYVAGNLKLVYLGTAPAHRHRGYGSQLLRELLQVTDKRINISVSVDQQHEGAPYLERILSHLNFEKRGTYTSAVIHLERSSEQWFARTRELRERFCVRFEKRGFHCVSFREADPALLEQVRLSRVNGFRNTLDARALFDTPGYILPDMSFVLFKGDTVVAYSIVSSPFAGVAEFDQVAAAEGRRGTGLALVPSLCSVTQICSNPEMKKIRYQVFDDNESCLRVIDQFSEIECTTQTKVNMFYYVGG